jgi:hypothetical protein
MSAPERCPLCVGRDLTLLAVVQERPYWRCADCMLTFMQENYRLSSADEKARYKQHNNDPNDPEYRAFLARLTDCMLPCLQPGSQGLDYGSGPGPTISIMLEELGFSMNNYDPFFTDESALFQTYDFITCSETAEHFHGPSAEFARFDMLLRPGGVLGIMTGILYDDATFADWWYLKDPTHTAFYRPETFQWIAARYRWSLDFPRENVAIYIKPADDSHSP